MKIKELCRKTETIKENDSLRAAGKIMKEKRVDFIVVLSKDLEPLGIVTAYEILEKEKSNEDLEKIKPREAMFTNILIINEDDEKEEAIKTLLAHKHWFAIVVDKNKKFKGVVSASDLI